MSFQPGEGNEVSGFSAPLTDTAADDRAADQRISRATQPILASLAREQVFAAMSILGEPTRRSNGRWQLRQLAY